MKKLGIILLCLLLNISNVQAENDKIKVTFKACVDGDTAKFILDDQEITARFLAIDTPETVHPTIKTENYGKEASDYTCNSLKQAQNIMIEYDTNSDKYDKYDRHLVWIWVDGYLLQNQLIKAGLAEVAYLYGDYKYTPTLQDSEALAKVNKLGLWSDGQPNNTNIYVIIGGLLSLILIIFSSKLTTKQKKIINKIQKRIS